MSPAQLQDYSIAAIVPALNEEVPIAKVISDLKKAVPSIDVYVYDNNSTDNTVKVAREAGAIVRTVTKRGKGNVIRRAFADIEADIYVMIDGDDTYEASHLPAMIEKLIDGNLDHVLGVRTPDSDDEYRSGHAAGNRAFSSLASRILKTQVSDIFSGYRVFSRRFVKSFPSDSQQFEIETELTVHMAAVRAPQSEFNVGFRDRDEGSESKLHTVKDGTRILRTLVRLYRYEFPMRFYGILSAILLIITLILGTPVIVSYINTGLVPRLPTAVLSAALGTIAIIIWILGLILSGQQRLIEEVRRLHYLRFEGVSSNIKN